MEIIEHYFKQAPVLITSWEKTIRDLEDRLAIPSGTEGYVADEETRALYAAQIDEKTEQVVWARQAVDTGVYTEDHVFTSAKGVETTFRFDLVNEDSKLGSFGKFAGQTISSMHETNLETIRKRSTDVEADNDRVYEEESKHLTTEVSTITSKFSQAEEIIKVKKNDEIKVAVEGLFKDVSSEHPAFFNDGDYKDARSAVFTIMGDQESVFSGNNDDLVEKIEVLYEYYGNPDTERSSVAKDNLASAEAIDLKSIQLHNEITSSYGSWQAAVESTNKTLQKVLDLRGVEATITDAEYLAQLATLKSDEASGTITPTKYLELKQELDAEYNHEGTINDVARRLEIRSTIVPNGIYSAVSNHSSAHGKILSLLADSKAYEEQNADTLAQTEEDLVRAQDSKIDTTNKVEAEIKNFDLVTKEFEVTKAKQDAVIAQLTADMESVVGEEKIPFAEQLLEAKMNSIKSKLDYSNTKLRSNLSITKLNRNISIFTKVIAELEEAKIDLSKIVKIFGDVVPSLQASRDLAVANAAAAGDAIVLVHAICEDYDNNGGQSPAVADAINRMEGSASVFPQILSNLKDEMLTVTSVESGS